jgi:hypothetical protein
MTIRTKGTICLLRVIRLIRVIVSIRHISRICRSMTRNSMNTLKSPPGTKRLFGWGRCVMTAQTVITAVSWSTTNFGHYGRYSPIYASMVSKPSVVRRFRSYLREAGQKWTKQPNLSQTGHLCHIRGQSHLITDHAPFSVRARTVHTVTVVTGTGTRLYPCMGVERCGWRGVSHSRW